MRTVQPKNVLTTVIALAAFALVQAQTYVGIPKDKFDYVAATQHNDHWCWAATIEMMMHYYNIPVSQEEIVKRTFGTDRYGDLPDFPASHEVMTENLNTAEVDAEGKLKQVYASHYTGAPEVFYLIDQLTQYKPVVISYETGENTEHAVIITGISYEVTAYGPRIESIIVRDPWPSEERLKVNGRVEYDAADFYNRITAYWDVNIGNADANQYAQYERNRNTTSNRNNNYTRTYESSYSNNTRSRTSENTSDYYYSSTSTAASSMSDRGNGTSYRPGAASSSVSYSAQR